MSMTPPPHATRPTTRPETCGDTKETPEVGTRASLRPKRPWTTARHTTQISFNTDWIHQTSPVSAQSTPAGVGRCRPRRATASGSASTISIRYVPHSRSLPAATAAAIRYTPHGKMHVMCTHYTQPKAATRLLPLASLQPLARHCTAPQPRTPAIRSRRARAETALSHALDPLLRPRRLLRDHSFIAGQRVAAPHFAAPRLPCH